MKEGAEEVCLHLEKNTKGKGNGDGCEYVRVGKMQFFVSLERDYDVLCHWNGDIFFFVHGKQTKINSEWEG